MIMLISISVSAQSQDKKIISGSKVEQRILALDKEWADASLRSDASAFDRLFDENIVVTAGNGAVRNKAQEISDSIPKNPNNKVASFITEMFESVFMVMLPSSPVSPNGREVWEDAKSIRSVVI
jgi:hypothetical protein